jgi:hypothetical protein
VWGNGEIAVGLSICHHSRISLLKVTTNRLIKNTVHYSTLVLFWQDWNKVGALHVHRSLRRQQANSPSRLNDFGPFGLFGLTSQYLSGQHFRPGQVDHTLAGQDVLINQSDVGQCLAFPGGRYFSAAATLPFEKLLLRTDTPTGLLGPTS